MYKDKLDYLIAVAAIGCGEDDVEMFNNLDTSGVVFDKSFYRIRDRRIRQYKRKPFVNAFKKIMSRVAVVVLAILSAGMITVAAIPSLRNAVWGAIVEWYEDYITINYATAEDEIGKTDVAVNRPTRIEQVKKPTYYQEGLVEDITYRGNQHVYIDYYLDDAVLYSYKQLVYSEDEMYVNNESAIVQSTAINGYKACIVELIDSSHKEIIWSDGIYIYQLFTELCDWELLISVAESIE